MTGGRLRGEGLLALWGNADPEQDAGFNDWYTHEHLPERIAVPGFLRARRYVADLPGPAPHWTYLTLYETDTLATLSSPGYLRALDTPTEGTRRYLPLFGAMARTGCRVTYSAGTGEGGDIAFVELGPRADPDALRRWIVDEHAPAVLDRSGVLAVHLAEADPDATAVRDRTESYRGVPTTAGRWLLLVEGATVDPAAARERLAADVADLEAHGADVGGAQLFRLLARLTPDRQRPAP
ncbi:DUF4286 family protein [Pseudonocardia acidicola]|uniref:Uncharacterized protein n=1 Tax=Pseudonocardia acidicola TaxID=2724939 RepID=A0ABX1SA84_9PSEU|nr:DUF4286 family protein [Pseudonocardia acidicola]NMH97732.1 hypothetical protein [Pseudonocardia acidicola]